MTPLPLGLSDADLARVELSLTLTSAKAGAGIEAIVLTGTGHVRLIRTRRLGAPTETLEGDVPRDAVLRLLELLQDEGFDGWPEAFEAKEQPAGRTFVLKLARPGAEKTVIAENWETQSFARVSGAVRLVAALARPEVLGKRFFGTL